MPVGAATPVAAGVPIKCRVEGDTMRISDMKIEELVEGLEPVQMDAPTLVSAWLRDRAIHPGGARVPATTLYDDFKKWYLASFHSKQGLLTITAWGRLVKQRLKYGRGSVGVLYYVSRKSTEKIVKELQGLEG